MLEETEQKRTRNFSNRAAGTFQVAGSAGISECEKVHVLEQGTGIRDLLIRVERMLRQFLEHQPSPEWLSTDQFAKEVGLAEVTVRGHCRTGRLNAEKKKSGRGAHASWAISRIELLRYQREGLLPSR